MNRIHLELFETNDFKRRITRLTSDHGGKPIEVFHEFDRATPLSSTTTLDGHVLAVFLYVAAANKPLVVHGPLSTTAMRNLHELSLFWNRWLPNRYRPFDITPTNVVHCPPNSTAGAITAFSGGADSTFTALRHAVALNGNKDTRFPLRSALMIQGFDVDIYNSDDFKKLVKRVTPFITALGLDFRTTRTNSRELKIQNWEHSAGLEVAACLHMQAPEFQFGLISSSSCYDELDISRGSSPITDHLMSGSNFEIVHDGAGFSRTEKIAAIMQHPLATRTLKVCWADGDQSRNCGRCEKCMRTRLNFLAAGASDTPPCFTDPIDLQRLRAMHIHHAGQLSELASILTFARKHYIDAPWTKILEQRIAEWRATPEPTSLLVPIKKFAADALAIVDLDQPATKLWRRLRRPILKKLEAMTAIQPKLPGRAKNLANHSVQELRAAINAGTRKPDDVRS